MIATEKTIRIAGIANDSIVDGPGLRMTIFLQGCRRHCEGCHNRESWPLEGGEEYRAETLLALALKNPLLAGVTFSGGEPLLRARPLLPLAAGLRERGLDLVIFTGYVFEDILADGDKDVLALLGLASVLVDGPFVLAEKSLMLSFRGSKNQRVLDLAESLAEGRSVPTKNRVWCHET